MKIKVSFKSYIIKLRGKIKNKLLLSGIQNQAIGNWSLYLLNLLYVGRKEFKILPLTWFDDEDRNAKKILREGIESCIYPPNFLGRCRTLESIITPSVYYAQYKNARVQITSSSVVVNDQKIVIERAEVIDREMHDYAQAHVLLHDQRNAVICLQNYENILQGIFLGGNGSSNYYHWLIELVVKLEFIPFLPSYIQNYPLLISEDVFQIKSFEETLEFYMSKLSNKPRIIVLKKICSYMVNDLVYINTPNSLPFNLLEGAQFKASYVAFDSRSINYLRNAALKEAFDGFSQRCQNKKIFFYRNNSRRNYNQDEVFSYLETYGFAKVNFSELSFLDQVRTIHNADYIIGPTGAEWTNLVFAQKGTKALCWMAQEISNFSAFSTIAGIIGVDLKYITYSAGVSSTASLYSAKYCIDLNMVELGLKELGLYDSKTFVS
jgi:capsular polysaccharide biosynthesis protein